jgi:carboxypeptidase Taq
MVALLDRVTELRRLVAEVVDLAQVAALVGWDQETMMPPKGAHFRATQQATLHGVIHERLTDRKIGDLLDGLEEPSVNQSLSDVDRAMVRVIRRDYKRATKLPASLVIELATVTTQGLETWRRAREESRWELFAPDLTRIIDLKRQEAACIGYQDTAYDALLDEYEPGATTAQLQALFGDLRRETVQLLDRIDRSGRQLDRSAFEQPFDSTKQLAFTELILTQLGFDFTAGRQDKSTHPFTTSFGPTDVRVTTRVDERDLGPALYASIHEAGHGLYEQGVPLDLVRVGLGDGASLGIHESQSRLWENFIGRGLPFWQYALPRLRDAFPASLEHATPAMMVAASNRVERSLIRVEADEVTYNLHIIIRFEIERRLIAGEIQARDLPSVWNDLTRDYLGITPPDDRNGVLQDTHWAAGLFGYFPTYSLGNVYGAQLWATLRRQIPDLDDRIAVGEFGVVLDWMRDRIHRWGRMKLPGEIIQEATGEAANPKYLVAYLNEKYGALYGF